MLILELAVQGVRGFSPSARVALKPGYTVLKSPTEIPAPLAGLALALVFPDGRGGDGAFLAPGAKAGRAGLSLQSNDQEVWRVVRDLGGQGALHRLNRQTNQFEVLTQDAGEILQSLRAAGLPARPTFEQLFTFSVGQLPSRRPKASSAQKTTTAMPARSSPSQARVQSAFDQYANELTPSDSGPSVEKLAALEKELAIAKEVADLQFRMDGVQADAFKAEQKLKAYDEVKGKLEAARAELFKAPTPQSLGLPDDIVERVRRSGDEKKRKEEALAKLEREKADAGISDEPPRTEPLWKDMRFLAGFAVGLLLLVAGVLLEGMGRFLALAAIPAFTFAGLLALRFIEELQHASREIAKREVFETRRKKIEDEFGLAAAIVQTALDKVEANTPDEFFTIMAKRAELQPAVGELELEFADYESDPDTAGLADTVARLKHEHEEMNQRLLGLSGGYAREVREIERELTRMKEALAGKTPAPSASGDDFSAVPTGPGETFDDPCPAPMQLACEIFSADLPTLWGVLRDRCVQYLMALTDKRYHAVDLDANGRATVQAPGRSLPAGELPPKDLDLLYLSLRLTLAEKAGAQTKLPVLLEDAFGGVIDVNKQALFARMLKHIGTLTQVLHVIGASQQPPQADAVLGL
jgi:hypothetical protein